MRSRSAEPSTAQPIDKSTDRVQTGKPRLRVALAPVFVAHILVRDRPWMPNDSTITTILWGDQMSICAKTTRKGFAENSTGKKLPETIRHRHLLMSAAVAPFLLAGLVAAPAVAQDAGTTTKSIEKATVLNDLIVTSTRRPERLQNVPVAVTVNTQRDLQIRNITTIDQLSQTVPGLTFNTEGPNSGNYEMRGIGTQNSQGLQQSTVGVYLDDMPVLDSFAAQSSPSPRFFDLERVEVLRGPQGTLFGSGTLSGAIRILTNKPDVDHYSGAVEATAETTQGGDPSESVDAMLNLPLIKDHFAVRLTGYDDDTGGYIDNITRDEKNVNSDRAFGYRLMAKLIVNDQFDVLGTIDYQHDRPADSAYGFAPGSNLGSVYQYNSSVPVFTAVNYTVYNLVAHYQFGGGYELTSSSSYFDRDAQVQSDITPILEAGLHVDIPTAGENTADGDTFTQELRLSSPTNGRFRWIAGLFYLDWNSTGSQILQQPLLGPFSNLFTLHEKTHSTEAAFFGEATYKITDKLEGTVGVRVFDDTISLGDTANGLLNGGVTSGINSKHSETKATPKFVLTYKFNPDQMVYLSASEGYRIGQNNFIFATSPGVPAVYGADTLWDYELGAKASLLDHKLTVDAALYYLDWDNPQVTVFVSPFSYIENAGHAASKGFELEASYTPWQALTLTTALSIDHAALTVDVPGIVQTDGEIGAKAGDRLPGSPEFTISNSAQYNFRLFDKKSYVRVDQQYIGTSWEDLEHAGSIEMGGYTVVNFSAGINFGPTELSAFLNNAFNSKGVQNAFVAAGGAPARAIVVRPLTGGVTLRAHF